MNASSTPATGPETLATEESSGHAEATAVLEAPQSKETDIASSDDVCVKCATPRDPKIGWCARCGFYPMIGTYVEVDPWHEEDGQAVVAKQPEEPFKLTDIPVWAVGLATGVAVLIAMSVGVRLLTPADSSLRTGWALSQLATGVLTGFIGTLGCYLFAIMDDDSLGLLDMLLKPIRVWVPSLRDLPHSFRRVSAGLWGFTAAVLALVVIDGIPYHKLWEGERRAKVSLVHAITQHAAQAGADDEDLEGAIGNFAGKAGIDNLKKKEIERKRSAECLIIGYMPLGDRDFSSLILASIEAGQLRYIGTVSEGVPQEVRQQLNGMLRQIPLDEPFVKCSLPGLWVRPMLVCNVHFQSWTHGRTMNKPLFIEMLADVDAPSVQ